MKGEIGAPGDGISRRQFLAATGSTGVVATAGCLTSSTPSVTNVDPTGSAAQVANDLPTTGRPEVVDSKRGTTA